MFKTMKSQQTLGQRVKILRDFYRLSQTDFGSAINLSHVAVANIEKGDTKNPQKSTIDSIVKTYGTTYDWLDSGKGEMLPDGKVSIKDGKSFGNDPWKDVAFSQVAQERDYFKEQYTKVIDAILSGNLGKLLALKESVKMRKAA